MLCVENVSVGYGDLTILNKISFTIEERQWLMVVGPNGAGKSTLIHAISQGVSYSGDVRLNGAPVAQAKPAELAKLMGVLLQNHHVGYSFTVEEVVRLGRYAYTQGIFSTPSDEDERMIEYAMSVTGMLPFKNQSVLTLSGGELQRTFLAQLLAQNPRLLILDEPSNHLDLVYQKQVFNLIQEWRKQSGRAVISVVHDLSLAKAYGTHALLLNNGELVAHGQANAVLTRANLQNVYAIDVYDWMQHMLSQWQSY